MVRLLRTVVLLIACMAGSDSHAQRAHESKSSRTIESRRIEIERSVQRMSDHREYMRLASIRGDGREVEDIYVKGSDHDKSHIQNYLAGLTPRELTSHLYGAQVNERRLLEWRDSGDPLFEMYTQLRHADGDRKLEAYTRILDERQRRHRNDWLNSQGPHVTSKLHRFITARGGTSPASRETELTFVGPFADHLIAERYSLTAKFPSLVPFEKPLDYTSTVSVAESNVHPWQHELRRGGLESYIARSPMLRALGITKWEFNHAGLKQIARIVDALEAPLPGGEPEVMYFFDPAIALGAKKIMTNAWTSAGRAEPKHLDHADLGQLMGAMSGKTLLLIGHIEDQSFVMERGRGQEPLVLNIPEAIEAARENGVFFLPIGCESARAGAYYGFQRPISTAEVAKLLAAIPAGSIRVGDVLQGFSAIGGVSVDVTNLHSFLEIVVRGTEGKSDPDTRPVVIVRIPAAPSSSSAVDEFVSEWATARLSWYDKGFMAPISTAIRSSPAFFSLIAGALLLIASTFFSAMQRRRAHTKRWSRSIRWARLVVRGAGIALVLLAVLNVSIPLGIGLVIFMSIWYLRLAANEAA